MSAVRTVTFDGATYKVRGRVEIPNLDEMPRFDALIWINRHTYARGYSRGGPNLRGLGDLLRVRE